LLVQFSRDWFSGHLANSVRSLTVLISLGYFYIIFNNTHSKKHPNIAVVNRSINLFNDNIMQHFREVLKNRRKQMTLDMFLFKEKSSGSNVNEPQLSSSGFQMKEG
jgi:hypothetical protein